MHWDSSRSIEMHRNPLRSIRIPQNPLKSIGIHQNPLRYIVIPQNLLRSIEIHQNPLRCIEIYQNPVKSRHIEIARWNADSSLDSAFLWIAKKVFTKKLFSISFFQFECIKIASKNFFYHQNVSKMLLVKCWKQRLSESESIDRAFTACQRDARKYDENMMKI